MKVFLTLGLILGLPLAACKTLGTEKDGGNSASEVASTPSSGLCLGPSAASERGQKYNALLGLYWGRPAGILGSLKEDCYVDVSREYNGNTGILIKFDQVIGKDRTGDLHEISLYKAEEINSLITGGKSSPEFTKKSYNKKPSYYSYNHTFKWGDSGLTNSKLHSTESAIYSTRECKDLVKQSLPIYDMLEGNYLGQTPDNKICMIMVNPNSNSEEMIIYFKVANHEGEKEIKNTRCIDVGFGNPGLELSYRTTHPMGIFESAIKSGQRSLTYDGEVGNHETIQWDDFGLTEVNLYSKGSEFKSIECKHLQKLR